ncbi:MAG TPA: penicillin acylase family protein [Dongiaceae bacterium]|nr:penicillin acylase family protein [Dongiaceae bacterium]
MDEISDLPLPVAGRRRRWRRVVGVGLLVLGLLLALILGGGFYWLRSSLPQLDGQITLDTDGLHHPVSINRDDDGFVAIKAADANDAAFALGFAHAQDRLFQMDSMRRLGSGRLAEIVGAAALPTDRRMRVLDLRRQAQSEYEAASPALKSRLDAYAAGVNAFLAQHHGALPPEFIVLNYRPEPWSGVDSLVWGRLMALQLSYNSGGEVLNAKLKAALPDELYRILTQHGLASSAIDMPARTDQASNNWVVAGSRTASGKPILANDPHLGLTAPSTWYLARIETPDRTLIGATAPGLPLLVIGSNGRLAWGFTTTTGDVQDIFDEKIDPQHPDRYLTPNGSQPFETRHEIIKVKGQADEDLIVRSTRHGPVISDTLPAKPAAGHVLSLAWTAMLPDDRTAEALLGMNEATTADDFRAALQNFAAPQQNIVYADVAGTIGFVAPGRIPVRRNLYDQSRLPVPGWTDSADWIGMVPFEDLPQAINPDSGWIATANNDITAYAKGGFYGMSWDLGYRYQRIAAHLRNMTGMTVNESTAIQRDIVSLGVQSVLKDWLPMAADHADIVAALRGWNGEMHRDRPEPLIATAWIDHLAHRLLAKRLGDLYDQWWFWQTDVLTALTADDRWCDDPATPAAETCRQQVTAALDDALDDLAKTYGADWKTWRWGDAHRVTFENPLWRQVPLINRLLRGTLPDDGDYMTVDNATASPSLAGDYPATHGPSMRFSIDMAQPLAPVFSLAGGQSGNPLSAHYDDLLPAWRDGIGKPILTSLTHHLLLQPTVRVP